MGMSDRCKALIPTEELRGIQVLQAMSYFRSPAGSNWPAIGEAESEPSPRQLIERRLTRHDVTIGIHVTEFVPRPAITALTSLGDLAKAAEEGPNPGQALLSTSRTQIQSLALLVFAHVKVHVEISGWSAIPARVAFAGKAYLHPRLHSGWDGD